MRPPLFGPDGDPRFNLLSLSSGGFAIRFAALPFLDAQNNEILKDLMDSHHSNFVSTEYLL